MFGFLKKNSQTPYQTSNHGIPSIWVGSYHSHNEWLSAAPGVAAFDAIADAIDDKLLPSRREVPLKAWCAACGKSTTMRFRWYYSSIGQDGAVTPPWTETPNCDECCLNSRMRAVLALLNKNCTPRDSDIYITEAVTDGFRQFSRIYPKAIGSEYFGGDKKSGTKYPMDEFGLVRHEDLTKLSFPEASFDAVIAQEVFEHIPDYIGAFAECKRVLKAGGRLVFTIPFSCNTRDTLVRAKLDSNGKLVHLHPAVYHGNPVDSAGSLCFQDFGWDVLEHLRDAGFRQACAHMYWGPWQGHLGTSNFVFEAVV